MNKILRIGIVIAATTLLAACAHTVSLPPEVAGNDQPGFFWGFLHGFIVPFSFIGSLFSDNIAIYAINNSGGWYDFGFLLGSGVLLGGAGSRS